MTDSTQTIFQSARRFFSGTALSRLAGMLRDMSMAYVFGTHVSIASFMLAFRFSHLFRRLLGEGALQSAFIPEFEAIRCKNEQQAFSFFRNLVVSLSLLLITIILLGCGILWLLKAYGHFNTDNQEVLHLTMLMLPSLLFICLFGINASLLQCEKSYFTPSVAPVGFNVIWIIVVLLLQHMEFKIAMHWLSGGVIIACFFQWAITVPKTYRILKKGLSKPVWKDIQIYSADVVSMVKPLALGIMGVASSQVNNAIDSIFARFAEPEGPALLWYAIRVQQLPLALFGIAIAGAILPPLSRAIKALDWPKYHHFIAYAIQKTTYLMLPITFFLLVSGDACINLIYGRGDFTNQSVGGTTGCLWAYGAGLLPSALVLILAPACYAQSNYRWPAYASFLTMILNGVLNTLMIVGLGLGATSVALATSVSAWVNLFLLSSFLSKKSGSLVNAESIKHFMKIGFATLLASVCVIWLRSHFSGIAVIELFTQKNIPYSRHFFSQLYEFVWQGSVFVLVFGGFIGVLNFKPKIIWRLNNSKDVSGEG